MNKKQKKDKELEKKAAEYSVKLEVMAPVELIFRIFAETPEEAAEMVSRNPIPPLSAAPRPIISRMKRIKATVYKAGTNTYYFVKNYRI
jgi:hypothetical protein